MGGNRPLGSLGGIRMRRAANRVLAATLSGVSLLGLAAIALAAPASPQSLVDQAYDAMGGDKLRAITTISLKAHLAQYDPGESYSVSDPDKPGVNSSELIQYRDLSKNLTRNEWWDRPKNDEPSVRR